MAAEKTGVLVHAYTVMSNHYHAVVTDPLGRIPEFLEHLHKYVAKCMNASLGRWENFWATEQPSLVRLEDDEDVLKRLVYTLTNPVEAFLVDRHERWPGLISDVEQLSGVRHEAPRPGVFFRPEGPTPEVATLELTRPAIFEELDDATYVAKVREAVRAREAERRAEARSGRIRFLGRRRVLAQRHTASPQTTSPRRDLKPRVAAANKWRRIEALRRLRGFIEAYRTAWEQWRQGARDVLFPPGTYALARHAGATAAPG